MEGKKPFIIGISGGSGSGKTSIINSLEEAFTEDELCIVLQDDYYKPREKQEKDSQGIKNFDRPESFEIDKMHGDLLKIIAGQSIEIKEYRYNNQLIEPVMKTINPAPVMVLEGLFLFYFEQIRGLLDVKIFVHAKDDLKIIRRIKRDREERNYPLEDVLYRYEYHVAPTFEKFILPYRDECDLVINNNDHFQNGFNFLKSFIEMKLRGG